VDVGQPRLGYAWDRNLTDNDGPYIELMAGVYTERACISNNIDMQREVRRCTGSKDYGVT
jgi:hypothetical protein